MNSPTNFSQYIHEGADEDYLRLLTLNKLVNQDYLKFLRLSSGIKILNIGSGPAILAIEMANEIDQNGKIYCIERDEMVCKTAKKLVQENNLSDTIYINQGDVLDIFPLLDEDRGTFDLAEARFLLEHVADPQRVVNQMVQSVRLGGRIILCDDDHSAFRLYPDNEDVSKLITDLSNVYIKTGNDPFVGKKLAYFLMKAGAEPVRSSIIHFGGVAGSAKLNDIVNLTIQLIINTKPLILKMTDYDERSLENMIEKFHIWSQKIGSALWYAIPMVEAIRKR